jgi:hypothetical protein
MRSFGPIEYKRKESVAEVLDSLPGTITSATRGGQD